MSKTFTDPTNDSNELFVDQSPNGNVRLTTDSTAYVGITLAPSDAPALALAVLEAAGYTEDVVGKDGSDYSFAVAMKHLHLGVVRADQATAEAEEQAKLEAEAYNLYRAWAESIGGSVAESLDDMHENAKWQWLAVARKARELAKGAGE